MKTVFALLVFLGFEAVVLADPQPVTFYAQLIRGSDADKPAQPGWKAVGPKLSRQLCPQFRWKNYWEVSRQSTSLLPGKAVRIRLSPEREVEVELRNGGESEIRLFNSGKLARKSRQKLQSKMTIMGGGLEEKESWFIVVRTDKPSID